MIAQEPSSQKGMPFPRYKGIVGKIIGKRGKSYLVEIVVGKKRKTIISRAEHLKKL
jgi:large subunit ribosomal protein L21e